jgi:GlpG protein
MYAVVEVSPEIDLSQFSRLLWQRKLSHQIREHNGMRVVIVHSEQHVPQALELYRQWRSGAVQPAAQDDPGVSDFINAGAVTGGFLRGFGRAPLTFILIAVCCALAVFAPLAAPTALTFDLLYPDFSYGTRTIVLSRVFDSFGLSELFRMVTPILLHGGLLHLLFNMMWLWELGPRIERAQSSAKLAITIVVLALVSNTVQYIYGGGNNFGGMSGVIYGLFTYIWMWQLIDPRAGLSLPASLIWFMVIMLVIMTALNLSMIADEAHLGGFFAGIVYGAVTALISRLLRTTTGPKGEA